jgi:hypothetical protein
MQANRDLNLVLLSPRMRMGKADKYRFKIYYYSIPRGEGERHTKRELKCSINIS